LPGALTEPPRSASNDPLIDLSATRTRPGAARIPAAGGTGNARENESGGSYRRRGAARRSCHRPNGVTEWTCCGR
jgi:hypothetical protein